MSVLSDVIDAFLLLVRILVSYVEVVYRLVVPVSRKSVAGRTVLITGAGHGLGRCLALCFARERAVLVLWDINRENNEKTTREAPQELTRKGHRNWICDRRLPNVQGWITVPHLQISMEEEQLQQILFCIPLQGRSAIKSRQSTDEIKVRELGATAFSYSVDCTSHDAVTETAQRVLEEVGSVYILINNAGILVGEDILNLTKDNITQTININLVAHFWTIRSFLPAMLEANKGHIVAVASMAGKIGTHRLTDYCASKFAVVGLHEALTDELNVVFNRPSVRTTVVCPLFINTGMIHGVSTRDGDKMMTADYVSEVILEGVLTNKREIVIPGGRVHLFLLLKSLLPTRGWEALCKYNSVAVPSQTQKDK